MKPRLVHAHTILAVALTSTAACAPTTVAPARAPETPLSQEVPSVPAAPIADARRAPDLPTSPPPSNRPVTEASVAADAASFAGASSPADATSPANPPARARATSPSVAGSPTDATSRADATSPADAASPAAQAPALRNDAHLLALRNALLGAGRSALTQQVPRFRPLCDAEGYPLVGNVVRGKEVPPPNEGPQPSVFCAAIRSRSGR